MNKSIPVKRVLVSLPPDLLRAADRQAQAEYTSRSDLMRRALVEYLHAGHRPEEAQDLFTDPEELARILLLRKQRVSMRAILAAMKRKNGASSS